MYRPPDLEHGRFDPFRDHTELGPVTAEFLRDIFAAHERMLDITSDRLFQRQLSRQNDKAPAPPDSFTPGQYVLLRYPVRAPSKLNSRHAGPYLFDSNVGRLCTIRGLTDGNEIHEVDIERIVPYIHTGTREEAELIAGQDLGEKQVRSVLAYRGNTKGKRADLEFQIEWFDSDTTWESWVNVRRLAAIDAYIDVHPELNRLRGQVKTKSPTRKK